MKTYPFKKLDAFATEKSEGNPAGCVFPDKRGDLSDQEMLQIAKELKGFVSEVGYFVPAGRNEFEVKYYSSERELDFCGHVTIAAMYELARTNEMARGQNCMLHTNRGTLRVDNLVDTDDSVFIMSPEPSCIDKVPDVVAIAAKLKTDVSEIDSNLPVSVINAGLNTLIVPIRSLDSILRINPELTELRDFCTSSGIDIIEVFTFDAYDKQNHCRTRVFAPTFGYIEDPATGSGNSAFGYYMIKNGLWKDSAIRIEQNGKKEQYNLVRLKKKSDENNNVRVWFGGGAIKRIEGQYILHG